MQKDLMFVLRNAGYDCTNNGLTSKVTQGWMFWNCTREDAIKYCDEKGINPVDCFYLVKRNLWGKDHSYAEPLMKPNGKWNMFGGNFIYTSNGNSFMYEGETTTRPIPVHDRFE